MAKTMFAQRPAPAFAHLGRNVCFSAAEAGPGVCALPTAFSQVPGEPDQKVSCQEENEQGEGAATESGVCAASVMHR